MRASWTRWACAGRNPARRVELSARVRRVWVRLNDRLAPARQPAFGRTQNFLSFQSSAACDAKRPIRQTRVACFAKRKSRRSERVSSSNRRHALSTWRAGKTDSFASVAATEARTVREAACSTRRFRRSTSPTMMTTRIIVGADPADGRFKLRLAAARRLAASEIPRQSATLLSYTILYTMVREGQLVRR